MHDKTVFRNVHSNIMISKLDVELREEPAAIPEPGQSAGGRLHHHTKI